MAARRANQVLATVGLFAALVAARVAVETFPVARAEHLLSALVNGPRPRTTPAHQTVVPEAPPVAEAQPAEPAATQPVSVLAEAPASDRRMPMRPSRGQPKAGTGLRVIRLPNLES